MRLSLVEALSSEATSAALLFDEGDGKGSATLGINLRMS
jgi:hypothetical protein